MCAIQQSDFHVSQISSVMKVSLAIVRDTSNDNNSNGGLSEPSGRDQQ